MDYKFEKKLPQQQEQQVAATSHHEGEGGSRARC